MELINNTTKTLKDDLSVEIKQGSKVSIAAACFSIAAFLEMKTPENEIMRLLSKFYGVDSIAETMELVTTVKVTNQVDALQDHLNELGMSRVEIANYLREHRVRTQLQADSKLQNMALDKLKAYFDKH